MLFLIRAMSWKKQASTHGREAKLAYTEEAEKDAINVYNPILTRAWTRRPECAAFCKVIWKRFWHETVHNKVYYLFWVADYNFLKWSFYWCLDDTQVLVVTLDNSQTELQNWATHTTATLQVRGKMFVFIFWGGLNSLFLEFVTSCWLSYLIYPFSSLGNLRSGSSLWCSEACKCPYCLPTLSNILVKKWLKPEKTKSVQESLLSDVSYRQRNQQFFIFGQDLPQNIHNEWHIKPRCRFFFLLVRMNPIVLKKSSNAIDI